MKNISSFNLFLKLLK